MIITLSVAGCSDEKALQRTPGESRPEVVMMPKTSSPEKTDFFGEDDVSEIDITKSEEHVKLLSNALGMGAKITNVAAMPGNAQLIAGVKDLGIEEITVTWVSLENGEKVVFNDFGISDNIKKSGFTYNTGLDFAGKEYTSILVFDNFMDFGDKGLYPADSYVYLKDNLVICYDHSKNDKDILDVFAEMYGKKLIAQQIDY